MSSTKGYFSLRNNILNATFLPKNFWRSQHITVGEADFITPQGFGRNSYPEGAAMKNINVMRHLLKDDVTTFEWLKAQAFQPGQPNTMLAHRCLELANQKCNRASVSIRPVIGQWEVLYYIYFLQPEWYREHQDNLVAIWPPHRRSFNTHGLLVEVQRITAKRGLTKPLLVAHPEHIQRCFFIARKIFGEAVGFDYQSEADELWFDPQSVQRWTRGPKAWLCYELAARLHHRFHNLF